MDSQQKSTRLSKNIYNQYFLYYSKEIETEGALPFSFYKAGVTLVHKLGKDLKQQKRIYRPLFL